ncbi:MAG: Glu/Leu/Phe/Val dehydrogenase [Methylotenera sp.]|nr:Glu/Leu/Phe/Val dehydrogenase [Oligoflexia bacterium]
MMNEFEQVVFCNDARTGLNAIISLHSTALGPATGGCRMWNYESREAALYDVLRLSKGMTYKNAISGLNWGGGKAVIVGDPKAPKNPEMLKRFGEFVERLGGHYITAKDVGIGSDDLRIVKTKTSHVLGIDGEKNSSGDPSPATAWGVYHGMRAAAKHAFGNESLKGLRVAMQGLGTVSCSLVEHLTAEGAIVIGCDIDEAAIKKVTGKFGIETVRADAIYDVPCDIFSPNALGATVNAQTLPRIKAKVIAGAANNQLATSEIGDEIMRRGMLYAPDYAINAGGVINIYHESRVEGGYRKAQAFEHAGRIGQTMDMIFTRAKAENIPPHLVADKIAEERVKNASQAG